MSEGELILYRTQDGQSQIQLRALDETVWLSQAHIAELFETTPQNITQHLKGLYADGELDEEATCKDYLHVRSENGRDVRRTVKLYSLDAILAIGYRVRSPRGIQFRQWATTRLREYLIKGFIVDKQRLADPGSVDYFDELLKTLRDIRSSEKRFYQKVRDLYATSVDYDGRSEMAQQFFATVQNKLLHAVTQRTAAELIVERCNPELPNAGLTSWTGNRVRKTDVIVAKNYLQSDELDDLNRIVSLFLDVAEDRAEKRQAMTMTDWTLELDRFLVFMDREVLLSAGKISHDQMKQAVEERYKDFDQARLAAVRVAAELEHEKELRSIAAEAAESIKHVRARGQDKK